MSSALASVLGEPTGQGWTQVIELAFAIVLSSAIGLERELSQKSAGLRTHTLVGVGAALFMLVSKYGFTDVLVSGRVILDPSRVAAQVVTGIGFIGGGLIFVRRESVQGLTTAAVVWVTAAVGAACGAGLPLLAAVVTVAHFVIVQGFPRIAARLGVQRFATTHVNVSYHDGRGILRQILATATSRGFAIRDLSTHAIEAPSDDVPVVAVTLSVQGASAVNDLVAALSELDGVTAVETTRPEQLSD